MKSQIVPVVVQHVNMGKDYQVFTAEYCFKDHAVKNVSKEYECFEMQEEVDAYIKGLKKSGFVYGEKK